MKALRIVLCAAQVPFVRGGAEIHVEALHRELVVRGHTVEVVRVPFKWYPKVEILKGALAWRLLDLSEAEGQPFKNIRERILPRSQTFTRLHLGHVDQDSAEWRAGIAHVLAGIAEGWLRVPIEGIFTLDQAADMHRRLEGRHVAGKLLLKAS